MALEEAVAPLKNFNNLMVNKQLSLYEEELNKQGRGSELNSEEASLEFKPIKVVDLQLEE